MNSEQLQSLAVLALAMVRAGGSAVVGLDPDAGLIAALLPHHPAHPSPSSHAASSSWRA